MKLTIVSVGKQLPSWIVEGYNTYANRFNRDTQLSLIEVPPIKRHKNYNAEHIIQQEGDSLLAHLPKQNSFIVALNVTGQSWSTEKLAQKLEHWQSLARPVIFLIGGPDGLSKACLDKADVHWSLSALTFPHPLVRLILVEQLYRATCILNNHPYHRGN